MRQRTGSIVCDGCGKLIDVSEPKCPYCGRLQPGLWGFGPALRNWLGDLDDLSRFIVVFCGLLYVLALLLDIPGALQFRGGFLGLLSPASKSLYLLGMTGGVTWQHGFWWTVLSAIYLHGGLLHILFNMYWVYNLGPVVQEIYGPGRLIVIFVLSGAIGFVISNVATGAPTIGASGSIFGLMAALILHGRRTGHALMTRQLATVAILVFIMGFVLPAVNNWAHAGGFIGGWLVASWQGAGLRRESSGVQILAIACVTASLLAIVVTPIIILTGIR